LSAKTKSRADAGRALGPGLRRTGELRRGLLVAVLAAGLLAGCGTARPAPSHTSSHIQAAAKAPDAPKAPTVSKSVRAEELAIHQQVLASLHQNSDAGVKYGSIPADLRNKQAPPANQVLSASAAHPAIAIQGNSVVLHLAHGSALATAVGPDVPDRIQGSADLHTPATWDLTFADVHGTVPISARLFTVTDEQGALLLPRVSVVGGGSLPTTAPAGRPFTLRLSTVVSVGDGKLRYAPSGGPWLAEWDFDVETD
jgi:hypothetical protein